MNRRQINRTYQTITTAAFVICAFILLWLLAVIAWYGARAISFEFLFTAARNFGADGGILYQILGSLLLVLFAGLMCFPIALGTALGMSEYLRKPLLKKIFSVLVYSLNGVPSVIFGIFGLVLFVNLMGTGISWFVGSVILAIMILPTVVLATYHALNSIPEVYRESAQALGLNRWQVVVSVLLPQGIGGAVTGLLLGLARAIGETAPILFVATAFSGIKIPTSFLMPVTTLPTHIFALSQQALDKEALQNAWGTSLVLVSLVVLFSALGLWSRINLKTVSLR